MRRWVVLGIVGVCGYFAWTDLIAKRPVSHGPGVVAARNPVQRELDRPPPGFAREGFKMTALASFELEARALSTKTYCCTGQNRLAPVDIAFGWGRMSDETVLKRIDISQSGRFYFWRYEGAEPIPRREIEMSSANMHLIPANAAVEDKLKKVRVGQVVWLKGYLVEVKGDDGFRWKSSLTREDVGDGACEVIWVEDVRVSAQTSAGARA